MEIGLKRGTRWVEYSITSVTRRMEGRGGKMYSFCAMYSLRMSFCRVPDMRDQSTPCFSPTARYMAHRMGAGELMVIDNISYQAHGRARGENVFLLRDVFLEDVVLQGARHARPIHALQNDI